ncbi:hypothetical protein FRC01_003177 [Tulasnella sp. 417]|nr:hypothetical protein FRC01_003177 [Tulasnella sp. 417]
MLTAAPKLAKTVLAKYPTPPPTRPRKRGTICTTLLWGRVARNPADEESKDTLGVGRGAAQLPEIVYGKGVALDMAGYHSAEGVGEKRTTPAKRTPPEGRSTVPSIVVLTTAVTSAEDVGEGAAKPSLSSGKEASMSFGQGGHLFPDDTEGYLFWVNMGGKTFSFQPSLCNNDEGHRRRFDDLESARWFEDEKVEYARLLADPDVAASEQLVMKWGDEIHHPTRQLPVNVGFTAMAARHETATGTPTAPTITVERVGSGAHVAADQPCAPAHLDMPVAPTPASPRMGPSKTATASINVPASTSTSTPRPDSPSPPSTTTPPPPAKHKNYVKTLRLSSDQLKALDLQKGANTSTFSLAATGVVACTTKIFVWEETDRVVVSDIDGTITRSDALGHMFNLIGRDWTHLGVAKLYADIARNGCKMVMERRKTRGMRMRMRTREGDDMDIEEEPVVDDILTEMANVPFI